MTDLVMAFRTVITLINLLHRWGNVKMRDRACWRETYVRDLVKAFSTDIT